MQDFLSFAIFISFIIFQRLTELFIARGNEMWMKKHGAIEFGRGNYPVIVVVHILFLVSFCFEKLLFNRGLSPFWPALLGMFMMAQILRVWIIATLGRFWNTKIIVLPHFSVIRKGPYRFLRHPNYLVVSLELILIPLLFNAFVTAVIFTAVNGMMLAIRIPEEEKALKSLTEYDGVFQGCHRFIPKFVK